MQLLIFENGIRGGLVQASMRYAKTNNYKTPDFDPTKPNSWLIYQDYNNLYGWAMSQYMPVALENCLRLEFSILKCNSLKVVWGKNTRLLRKNGVSFLFSLAKLKEGDRFELSRAYHKDNDVIPYTQIKLTEIPYQLVRRTLCGTFVTGIALGFNCMLYSSGKLPRPNSLRPGNSKKKLPVILKTYRDSSCCPVDYILFTVVDSFDIDHDVPCYHCSGRSECSDFELDMYAYHHSKRQKVARCATRLNYRVAKQSIADNFKCYVKANWSYKLEVWGFASKALYTNRQYNKIYELNLILSTPLFIRQM
ncbi:hypothetical protein AGLY_015601 [Aphis glycines]|uniref:DNA-directed DNA polymerase n=1 Tax=Aphis glycines TaxID=307491 RepID=A0A6G0T174_APHGL|nr:hypothetical protein AGLY_015601 [Aphis glycines]